MRYVIIGNSTAAIGCIEGIRSIDKEGEITVISSERHHTYSRPLISYLLYGKTNLERMKYRPDSFYEDNRCKVLLGVTVKKISPQEKTVLTEDGREITYDRLLVATGSQPFIPKIDGYETVRNKTAFMTLDDALYLDRLINEKSRVLIVGAGLIGLKCAEGIADRVSKITVCDLADRILPSVLDWAAAKILQKHIEKKSISFRLNSSVKSFEGNIAHMTDGKDCEFDILVMAVGVRPNVGLVADAGGKVGKGIAIDSRCATTLPDVYAAGDCTESMDISSGACRVVAVLPGAYMQGRCAGVSMAGGEARFDSGFPLNAGGFFGLHIVTAGCYDGEEFITADEDSYKKLVVKDNLLKGFIIVGDVTRSGIYTSLIREKIPLDTLDFDMLLDRPQLLAFSRERRENIWRRRA